MDPEERISMDEHCKALAKSLIDGEALPAGRLLGLPDLPEGDVWVDIAGAAALTGVRPKTITSWLARGGPSGHTFPSPVRLLYRLYWQRSSIESWVRRRDLTGTRLYQVGH